MANELFQFTIIDYTTNPAGDSTIVEEPIGWDGVEFELVRMETHGFVSSLNIDNIDFQFRGAAKVILDDAYDGWGNEAQVELKIEWRGNPSDTYTQIYLGLFKFLTYKNICGIDCYTTIGISMAGCYPLFHNRKNQSVDLGTATSFDGTALTAYTWLNKEIQIPPKDVQLRFLGDSNYANTIAAIPFDGSVVTALGLGIDFFFMAPLINNPIFEDIPDLSTLETYVNASTFSPPTSMFTRLYDLGLIPQIEFDSNNSNKLTCSNVINFDIAFDIDVTLNCNQGGQMDVTDITYVVIVLRTDGTATTLYNSTPITPPSGGFTTTTGNLNGSYVGSTTLITGDQVYYGITINNIHWQNFVTDFDFVYTLNQYEVDITMDSSCTETPCLTSMINETLSRQVEAYTNDCIRVKSDYFGRTDSEPYTSALDGCGSLEVFASGLNMRGARNAASVQPPFLLDFDSSFNGLKPIHNIGYGLEPDSVRGGNYEWLRVESYEYFYDNSVVLTLPYPNIITREVDAKEMVSQIKIGYNNWGNEQQGGRNDVFASREISSNISRVSNTLMLKSDLVASDFAIEFTRRIYGLSSVDSPFDDKVFIICMVRDGADIIVELFPSATATNVYSVDTMKNIRITPMRNLLRNIPTLSKYIKTSLAYEFYFKNGEANFIAAIDTATIEDCILEVQGVELREDNPITDLATFETASFGTPILSNELVSFEYPLTCAEWLTLKANPYGLIEYSCANGTSEFGWIKQFNYNAYQGMASFKLIKQL